MNKVYPDAKSALDGILKDGMMIMSGGFGLCGIAETLSDAIDAGIVGDHRQVLHPGIPDRIGQSLGDAAQAKAARHDHHAVLENAVECRFGVGIDLVHGDQRPDGGKDY